MTSKVDEFAAQFEANNQDYIDAVTRCSDDEWRRDCPNDGRSAAVVAHHMATVQSGLAGLIQATMTGQPSKAPGSTEEIDQINDAHAQDKAGVSKDETLDLLRSGGDAFLTQLRALSDEDLDRSVGILVGNEMTIGQVVQFAVIAHQREHLASIQAALAR